MTSYVFGNNGNTIEDFNSRPGYDVLLGYVFVVVRVLFKIFTENIHRENIVGVAFSSLTSVEFFSVISQNFLKFLIDSSS